MPNYLDLFGQNYSVNNNPLSKLAVNPTAFVGALPELLKLLDDLQSVLNRLIPELNALFGINLPDAQQLVAFIQNLLRAFNLTGAQSFLEQLISALGGSGSLLSDFHNAVSALAGIGQTLLDLLMNVFGITGTGHLIGDLRALLDNIFGSTFPKVFPFTFGTSTSGTPAPFVALAKFQQLLDGLKNDGSIGNDVAAVVGAFQAALDAARSDISQAILDGINGSNSNTGVAQGLQAFPNINITSILNQGSLGGDVGALATLLFGSHTVGTHILASIITNVLGGTDIGADLTALATLLFGSPTVGTHILASIITNVLGGTDLGADIGALATLLFGSHTVGAHVLSSAIANILGGTDLGADVQSIVSRLTTVFGGSTTTLTALMTLLGNTFGSTFPKVFPYTFGSSTSNTPAPFVTQAQFQQLVDGLVNNGTTGNTPATAIGAFQAALDAARSDVSQAIMDGVNAVNGNTGVAQALQNFPGTNLTSSVNAGLLTGTFNPVTVGVLRGMSVDMQSVIDALINAQTGGSGFGNDPSGLFGAYTAIPSANIVPVANPSGSGTITHDANNSSFNAISNSYINTVSIPLTIASTANYVVVRMLYTSAAQPHNITVTVSCGSQVPHQVAAIGSNLTYVLANPITGTQTITVTVQVTTQLNTVPILYVNADSYIGVGALGTVATTTGTQSSPTQTIASATNDVVLQTIGLFDSVSATLSAYSQTTRFNQTSGVTGFLAGDAAGASSVTGSATASDTSVANSWNSAMITLVPLSTAAIGSGFVADRVGTGTVALASGDQLIPGSFFDTFSQNTVDLAYTSSTNTITVTYAGWYKVAVGVLLTSTPVAAQRALLYHNGSIYRSGAGNFETANIAHSWVIFCNATDTLQPGIHTSGTMNATGEATGSQSYFDVGLMNRSPL